MEPNPRYDKLIRPLSMILAVVYLTAGAAKLAQLPVIADRFAAWGYPEPMMSLVGAIEIIGAVLLLFPRVASIGAIALGGVMVGAVYTHLVRGDPVFAIVPLVLLAALAFIGNRRLDSHFNPPPKHRLPQSWSHPEAPHHGSP